VCITNLKTWLIVARKSDRVNEYPSQHRVDPMRKILLEDGLETKKSKH
jgi:hypothetical protein